MMEWANSPATQELVSSLKQAKQEIMEIWASQGYEGETKNAFALGHIESINNTIIHIEGFKNESV